MRIERQVSYQDPERDQRTKVSEQTHRELGHHALVDQRPAHRHPLSLPASEESDGIVTLRMRARLVREKARERKLNSMRGILRTNIIDKSLSDGNPVNIPDQV